MRRDTHTRHGAALLVAQAPAASAADTVADLGVTSDRGGDVVGQSGKIFVAADDRIVVTKSDGTLIELAAYPCPSTLAQSYERLWVGYGCGLSAATASGRVRGRPMHRRILMRSSTARH
ncbi:hypothetical protein SAMN05421874_101146 [Nonomuraea maritima]|uniref:Uncharacterized protein n=2 Tax=Nonomuraea maritima TaxID=683260 RepID=A0A1G8S2J6_9ACTN|nr:hypothetical protein SAMN05421874_101146 [Nonomuraea maritima]